MPLPLVPVVIGGLTAAAAYAQHQRSKLTVSPQIAAERQVIYDTALNTVKDPQKIRTLAAAFREAGLTAEADMLTKRAELAEAPPDVKAARRDAFKKGMASKDPAEIRKLADAFQTLGATGAAQKLYEYASGVEAAAMKAPAQPSPSVATPSASPAASA